MDAMSRYMKLPANPPRMVWAGMALAGAMAAYLGVLAVEQNTLAEGALRRADVLRKAQQELPAPKVSRAEQDAKKRWDAYRAEREFDWEPLFKAVEVATGSEIELLELQPDKANQRVVLRGEALSQTALTGFLEALAAQAALTNVHLTHQRNEERNRLKSVAFEIRATLAPQARR